MSFLWNRPFVQNVLTLASGAAFAQLITLALSPLLTRLYGPEAFGLAGIFTSIALLLTTASAFSYPAAIVLPKSDWDAFGLVKISLILGLISTLVFSLVLIALGERFLQSLNAEYLEPYKLLMPLAAFVSLGTIIITQWLVRQKAFSIIAIYGVVASLLTNSLKLIFGLMMPSALMLIVTNIVGVVLSVMLTLRACLVRVGSDVIRPNYSSPRSLIRLAKTYRDFPFFRMPQNLINAFSHSLPVIMIAAYSGASAAGNFSLALIMLGAPAGIIGNAVMSVFYPKVAEAMRVGSDVQRMIVTTTLWVALVGVAPYLIVVAFGPWLFGWAFGQEWISAGEYSQWLAFWFFFQLINKPAVAAVPALRLQRGLLIYELWSTGAKVFALYIGLSLLGEVLVAIAVYSVVGVVAYIWLIAWVVRSAKEKRYMMV